MSSRFLTGRVYSMSLIPPPQGKTFGDVVPVRNHETSVLERGVRTFLKEHGFPARSRRCSFITLIRSGST